MNSKIYSENHFKPGPNDIVFSEHTSFIVSLILGLVFFSCTLLGVIFIVQEFDSLVAQNIHLYLALAFTGFCLVMASGFFLQVRMGLNNNLWLMGISRNGIYTRIRPQTPYFIGGDSQKTIYFAKDDIQSISYLEMATEPEDAAGNTFRYIVLELSEGAFEKISQEIENDRKYLHSKGLLSSHVHLKDLSKTLIKKDNCIGIDAQNVKPIQSWHLADDFEKMFPGLELQRENLKISESDLKEYQLFLNQAW